MIDERLKVSVVINTLNEQSNIADCIKSINDFADEIIICDMQSKDDTVKIAQQFPKVKIYSIEPMDGKYQQMRYLAIMKASCEWVLQIDADERMTKKLEVKLAELKDKQDIDLVRFPILFWYFDRWVKNGGFFGHLYPRFFKKKVFLAGYENQNIQAHNDLAALDGITKRIDLSHDYYLLHYAYPTIEKYVTKTLGMYSRQEAEQMVCDNIEFSVKHMILVPIKQFIRHYIFKKGFKDGLTGFILSFLYSTHKMLIWVNIKYLGDKK